MFVLNINFDLQLNRFDVYGRPSALSRSGFIPPPSNNPLWMNMDRFTGGNNFLPGSINGMLGLMDSSGSMNAFSGNMQQSSILSPMFSLMDSPNIGLSNFNTGGSSLFFSPLISLMDSPAQSSFDSLFSILNSTSGLNTAGDFLSQTSRVAAGFVPVSTLKNQNPMVSNDDNNRVLTSG